MHTYSIGRFLALVCVVAVLVSTTHLSVGAQEPQDHFRWAGPAIQQASSNWADYAAEPMADNTVPTWDGYTISQASMNWVDYVEKQDIADTPDHQWAGEQIQRASANWADFVPPAEIAAEP